MNMEINPSEYKILIVDDVMSNVLLLKVLLTNEKFAIATANNGRQALEQVDKEHPDLVLLGDQGGRSGLFRALRSDQHRTEYPPLERDRLL